jgi:hypothetical protein
MLCKECDKRPTCTELCEKTEEWVNKDHVPPHSGSESRVFYNSNVIKGYAGDLIWDYQKEKYNPKQLKRLIIQLYKEGKSQTEIAYHLLCSQPYIFKIITKFKKKHSKNK